MKKFFCMGMAFVLCLLSCGCLRRIEIVDTAIIQAVGIDMEDGEYIVTLQKFTSGGSGGQTPVDIGKENRSILQERGISIADALDKISMQTGRELFMSANHVLVIGKETARQGILPIISFFNSNYQTRPDTHVLISENDAADIITLDLMQGIVPAENINRLLKRNSFNSRIISTSLMDIVSALTNGHIDPYIPIAKISSDADGKSILTLSGTAVFQHDRMVGTLNPQESTGLVFLNNNLDMLWLNITDPKLGMVSLRLGRSDTGYQVRIEDGLPVYTVTVRCTGAVQQIVPATGGGMELSLLPELENAANLQIAQLMKSAVEKSVYRLGCDVCSLSKHLKQKQPAYWKEHQYQLDEINPQSRFEFVVDCNVNRIGHEVRHSYPEF